MIDPTLRNRRIIQQARDPTTAVILLDIVLGYGAHPDPAGAAVEAIREAHGSRRRLDATLYLSRPSAGRRLIPSR